MKIIIITDDFYPGNSPRGIRGTELVKEFLSMNHEVTLVSSILPTQIKKNPIFLGLNTHYLGEKRFKLLNSKNVSGQFLARIINKALQFLFDYPELELFFKVRKFIKSHKNKYDLLISLAYPYPIHWAISTFWSKKNKLATKWIADCGDPFMGVHKGTFSKAYYFAFIEKYFCQKCDYITVPIVNAIAGYYPEFHYKIRVIPQGFNFNFINNNKIEFQKTEKTRFCYAGSLYKKIRNPDLFFDALISLKLDFEFYLFTYDFKKYKYLEEKDGNRFKINGFINRDELIEFQSKMDFNINIKNTFSLQSPSKLIELSIIGRPILEIDPTDVDINKLVRFIQGDYSGLDNIVNLDDYSIKSVAKKFINLAV